jgi:DNA (cytosine-5)-methyltransferase 1
MYELSLFTGAMGGILGSILLGWETIGYVEINDYCQKLIKQRIEDGIIDNAPIFSDIKTFISEGYAESYSGMVDVITAGFPCQPYSVAGKGLAEKDPRNMWPATLECICIVRPGLVLLENVPNLLTKKYIRRIYGDLAEAGYDARWCVLGADDCGAQHRRKRWWLLAYSGRRDTWKHSNTNEVYNKRNGKKQTANKVSRSSNNGGKEKVAYSTSKRCGKKGEYINRSQKWIACGGENVPDSDKQHGNDGRLCTSEISQLKASGVPENKDNVSDTTNKGFERQESESKFPRGKQRLLTKCNWWEIEPKLGRVAHGVAHRVDRLKSIGNGQVPIVAKTVWRILTNEV